MRIATWNINSVRRRMSLVVDWLAANKPDVLCLQETKVPDGEFPAAAFIDAGYHVAFRGMKGYNGVATLTRREPESDRKSTRLNSSHLGISYAVFCLKK